MATIYPRLLTWYTPQQKIQDFSCSVDRMYQIVPQAAYGYEYDPFLYPLKTERAILPFVYQVQNLASLQDKQYSVDYFAISVPFPDIKVLFLRLYKPVYYFLVFLLG